MESREFESKTVEEAIADGLNTMDLSLEEVTVDVLDEGSKGLFGLIGAKPARVRLTQKPPVDLDTTAEEISQPVKQQAKPAQPVQKHQEPVRAPKPQPAPPVRAAQTAQPAPKPAKPEQPRRQPQEAKRDIRPVKTEEVPADAGAAGVFVAEVAKRMELDVSIQATKRDETLRIEILGDEKGILIGHRGETLDALQYLASLVHNKDKEPYERLQIDSQNYRRKREETLVRLANRLADKARRTRHRVALEPMNPYERRILHSALQGNPHVTTHSEGDEPNRRVVIQPK